METPTPRAPGARTRRGALPRAGHRAARPRSRGPFARRAPPGQSLAGRRPAAHSRPAPAPQRDDHSRSHRCLPLQPPPFGLPRARSQAGLQPRGTGSLALPLGPPTGLGHRVLWGGRSPLAAAAMGTDSRAAKALLSRARTLHLQTGNLLNWGRLRKKCPSTHSEEVSAASASPQARRFRERRSSRGRGRVAGPCAHLGSTRGKMLGPV
ncbi:hypothetical protein P7K49_016520 [Saguinus oedipus]|uniref:Uncharacterized protein n=1 Tax=Saguinus oedipus TaxID=9490 RepID=A0ABQ9VC98_SAGOE|nr:hypothetical protein P7K49_016520 [Saguinus oedipus]